MEEIVFRQNKLYKEMYRYVIQKKERTKFTVLGTEQILTELTIFIKELTNKFTGSFTKYFTKNC